MYAWPILALGIFFEVLGTTALKVVDGCTKPVPAILSLLLYGLSLWCVSIVLRQLDLSIAYAVWAGMGLLFIALIGIFFFEEQFSALKTISFVLILSGVVGLHIASGQPG